MNQLPIPRFKPRTTALPFNPTSIPISSFAQALPLHATNPVANNVNLLPHSPPAPFISSANGFVPQLIHPLPPQKCFQPQNFVPITHAPPAPPDPNVWRFPAAVPSNAVPLVRTSANLYTAQPAPLINPHHYIAPLLSCTSSSRRSKLRNIRLHASESI